MHKVELQYHADTTLLFEHLLQMTCPVFLDSGNLSRYDIMTAAPETIVTTYGPLTRIQTRTSSHWSFDDPFHIITHLLGPVQEPEPDIPFSGGALGYFSYDLGRRIEDIPDHGKAHSGMPELLIGIYEWSICVDHQAQQTWLCGNCPDDVLIALKKPLAMQDYRTSITEEINSTTDYQKYKQAFERIQHYILEGDCYQVNLARRFSTRVEGSLWGLYKHLRSISPAPFSAYIDTPYGSILSASPERFIRLQNSHVETCPIKGTRPRGETPIEDIELANELSRSEKDHAENIMIVDLLRNDLGKTCLSGSIKVPSLAKIQSFSNVHHLVSTVTGILDPAYHAMDLLRGCFPGGSITGAPKVRAMEIIDELEPERRGIYCGSIGYIGFDGNMDTNIAIRTVTSRAGELSFWAGGGIVADSDVDQEYQEILDKAQGMFKLIEQVNPV